MAAMEVFSVPEILEDIILRVACQAKEDNEASEIYHISPRALLRRHLLPFDYSIFRLEPATVLSSLCRVCSTFRHTIKGSPKLQRLFVGDPATLLDSAKNSTNLPLQWLFARAIGTGAEPDLGKHPAVFDTQWKQTRLNLKAFSDSIGKHPEAGWHQVKALTSTSEGGTLFKIIVEFRRPKGYKGRKIYCETVHINNDTTLGMFFDRASLILGRSGSEHVARAKELTELTR